MTFDEEIGQGAHKFDVEKFGADWAYTMDGGEIGELEYENFNAAAAKITFTGRNVHPGYAKHKMLNSIRIANQFTSMLPRWETPEHTDKSVFPEPVGPVTTISVCLGSLWSGMVSSLLPVGLSPRLLRKNRFVHTVGTKARM